jgi:ABC-type branched-subunit amino acid transport system substrate-binding protein
MLPVRITRSNRFRRGVLLSLLFLTIQSLGLAQPSSRPDDSLLLKEGETFLMKGDTEKALWRFRQLTTEFPNSLHLNEAKFGMGVCYTLLKRPRDALRVLNELLSTHLTPARMVTVLTLMGDNALDLKDPHDALKWYGKALLVPRQPQEEIRKKIRSIIDGFDSQKDLSQVENLYRGAYAGGYAQSRLARLPRPLEHEVPPRKGAGDPGREVGKGDPGPHTQEPLGPSPPAPAPSLYRIGVILPLSGIHQPFGERVLQSIQLAVREKAGEGERDLLSLIVRDSRGDPAEAERAVEELATRDKVIAILGPLLSITAERAARRAQQLKIPLFTFSQKEPLTGKGDFIFQSSLTPSAQVQTLAGFAVNQLKLRSFAVFYPNSPYGLHFKTLFTQEIARKGGKVLGAVSYLETQTDFSQEIKGFFRIESAPGEGSGKKREDEFKSGLSVDGLFIPDTYDRVGLILSQMAYYDVKGVTFLGNNGWNHPSLVSTAGGSAEGVTFIDAFSAGDSLPAVQQFVEDFRRARHRDPETLEALAFEAADLLRDILASKSPPSPLRLKEEITQLKSVRGVAGLRGFGEDGRMNRTLLILKVNNGKIEKVAP